MVTGPLEARAAPSPTLGLPRAEASCCGSPAWHRLAAPVPPGLNWAPQDTKLRPPQFLVLACPPLPDLGIRCGEPPTGCQHLPPASCHSPTADRERAGTLGFPLWVWPQCAMRSACRASEAVEGVGGQHGRRHAVNLPSARHLHTGSLHPPGRGTVGPAPQRARSLGCLLLVRLSLQTISSSRAGTRSARHRCTSVPSTSDKPRCVVPTTD